MSQKDSIRSLVQRLASAAASYVVEKTDEMLLKLPDTVCKDCVKPDEAILAPAGDYALCERCRASINSKTGVIVRRK